MAMQHAGGLISVSESYTKNLKQRYPPIVQIPAATITFGAFAPDLKIAARHHSEFEQLLDPDFKNIVYIGRGGMDMHNAMKPVFETLKKGLFDDFVLFSRLKLYFIGTSYAPEGRGNQTIMPLAKQFDVDKSVVEVTDRIGYYHTLTTLLKADALFIPGSDDPQYTASKIYPYLLTKKPLLAIFNSHSSSLSILDEFEAKHAYSYDKTTDINLKIESFFRGVISNNMKEPDYNPVAIEKYSAKMMAKRQCDLFNAVNLIPL